MNSHQHARTTPVSRGIIVHRRVVEQQSVSAIAKDFGISAVTVRKWLRRYHEEGVAGLQNRPSRPHRSPRQIPPATLAAIIALRRQRRPASVIAVAVGVSPATVSRVMRRHRLHRLPLLDPPQTVQRYERDRPGSLVHLDVKKIPRFTEPGPFRDPYAPVRPKKGRLGFAYVFAAVDDHSRVAVTRIFPNEQAVSAVAFLHEVVTWFAGRGVRIDQVLTDNGPCFRATRFRTACHTLGITPKRTRPWRPQTNGKVERFNRTLSQEWVYARSYAHSDERDQLLPAFVTWYNEHRPHAGIGGAVPISRLGSPETTS